MSTAGGDKVPGDLIGEYLDQPSTACIPLANFRHWVASAARAAAPLSVSP